MKASQKILVGMSELYCSVRGFVSVLLLRARAEGRLNKLREQRRIIVEVAALFSRAHRMQVVRVFVDNRSATRNLYTMYGMDPRTFSL
jgi:hypothetical protein